MTTSPRNISAPAHGAKPRVNWVDAVKGLTIILVVMKHTTYGTAVALGDTPYYFNLLCEWTIPFRMPLFFLVAGLFARKALFAPRRQFIDSKILHFLYFYLLWSFIQIGIKIAMPHEGAWDVTYKDLLLIPFEPFGLLWFIYALAIFFAFMRFARDVRPAIVIGFASALYFTRLHTGWTMPDETAQRFIYFVLGVYGAPYVFALADWAIAHARNAVLTGIALLALVAAIAFTPAIEWRALELTAALLGASGAIILVAVAAARGYAKPLSFIGSRSLYIFLAFFLPMAITRVLEIQMGFHNADLVTLGELVMAISVPLIVQHLLRSTPLRFLFERPDALKLKATPASNAAIATA
ncbi:MAG: acyltransferase family protein [Parvibaculum sp.]|nr:acyltransferase family protein [Parvibaculum sp.]